MANNSSCGKQHSIGGKVVEGNAKGAPKETSSMKFGNDLRSGQGKDNFKNK